MGALLSQLVGKLLGDPPPPSIESEIDPISLLSLQLVSPVSDIVAAMFWRRRLRAQVFESHFGPDLLTPLPSLLASAIQRCNIR